MHKIGTPKCGAMLPAEARASLTFSERPASRVVGTNSQREPIPSELSISHATANF